MNKTKYTPPAQLWVGNHTYLIENAKEYTQQLLCPKLGCKHCITCKKIAQEQHHSIIWLKTEKLYTQEDIAVIFERISFQLDAKEQLFFIIQHADFLTESCSNSLLKSVEEPPAGYHFIFLTERLGKILPTIQSRCTIKSFYTDENHQPEKKLFALFASIQLCQPYEFLKLLDTEKPNEKETIEIIDSLLQHWIERSKKEIENNKISAYKKSETIITKIKRASETLPMPGSSKLFWRNLYLQFKI